MLIWILNWVLDINTHFKVFPSYNILQYRCDLIHVLIFVSVSKCRKSPKLTNIVIRILASLGAACYESAIHHHHLVSFRCLINSGWRTESTRVRVNCTLLPCEAIFLKWGSTSAIYTLLAIPQIPVSGESRIIGFGCWRIYFSTSVCASKLKAMPGCFVCGFFDTRDLLDI